MSEKYQSNRHLIELFIRAAGLLSITAAILFLSLNVSRLGFTESVQIRDRVDVDNLRKQQTENQKILNQLTTESNNIQDRLQDIGDLLEDNTVAIEAVQKSLEEKPTKVPRGIDVSLFNILLLIGAALVAVLSVLIKVVVGRSVSKKRTSGEVTFIIGKADSDKKKKIKVDPRDMASVTAMLDSFKEMK